MSYSGDVDVRTDIHVTLREAARKENHGNLFTRNYCNCLGGCTNKRCSCKAKGILCSNRCHPQNSCLNRETCAESTNSDCELPVREKKILSRNGCLNDNHIRISCNVIKKDHTEISGLQDPVLQQNFSWNVPKGDFVQVLHVGHCHWITISNIGQSKGNIGVYDSLCSKPSKETRELIFKYVNNENVTINVMNVHRQLNGYDCGVYAVAFAKTLVSLKDPCEQSYLYPRIHMLNELSQGKLSEFPASFVLRNPKVLYSEKCVYCD